jgi:hypothetical protein
VLASAPEVCIVFPRVKLREPGMLLYVGVNSTPYDTVFIDETTDAAGSFRPRRSPGSPTIREDEDVIRREICEICAV